MKIFGFGKSREEKAAEARAQAERDAKNAEALELGRQAGKATVAAIDNFMTFRVRPVSEKVYGVFSDRLSGIDINSADSPVDVARIEFDLFIEQIDTFKAAMFEECTVHVDEWLRLADQMGNRADIEVYIRNAIANICLELFDRALTRGSEVIDGFRALGFKAILTADRDRTANA